MPKTGHSMLNWTGGEVSPKVDARADSPRYSSWLRQLQNLIAYKGGGITRRPGFQYIATQGLSATSAHNYCSRLAPFVFSPQTTFILEFTENLIRFYSNGAQVNVTVADLPFWIAVNAYTPGTYVQHLGVSYFCIVAVPANFPSGNTAPASDPTHWTAETVLQVFAPYSSDAGSSGPLGTVPIWDTDVFQLTPCQVNDVVYLASPNYPPYHLIRYSDLDWVNSQVPFIVPALLDQNVTDTTIAASATTGSVTLTATAPAWNTATYYAVADSVLDGGIIYDCVVPNTSAAAFGTDLAAGAWVISTIFTALQIGGTWQLQYVNPAQYLEVDGTSTAGFSNGTSGTIQALGNWEVHTYGVWSSDIEIQQSLDQGNTWQTVQVLTSRSDANFDVTGDATVLSLYRIVIANSAALTSTVTAGAFIPGENYTIATVGSTDFTKIGASGNTVGLAFTATGAGSGSGTATFSTAGATNPRVVFSITNAFVSGLVQITAVTNAYSATATVITQLPSTNATEYWSEAAWSNFRGFPAAVCAFQQRMIYGGTAFQPQRIWGTVTDDIENFDLGDQSLATDSFVFDINAPTRGPIQSLAAQLDLFVLFSGAEWIVNSGSTNSNGQSSGAAITPQSINAQESSSWGSAEFVEPDIVGDALFFTQRQGTSLRQMLFSIATDKYMTQDLTAESDHLFAGGIAQIAYQTRWRKQSLVWAVTQAGTLCALTYELDREVTGWHRHTTGQGFVSPANGNPVTPDNGFESVAVIPGQGLADDEVWAVTNRIIAGINTRFIERMNPNNWEETFTGAPNPPFANLPDAFYVDCGSTILAPGSTTLTGLSMLNGRYVVGLADGAAFGPILVAGGAAVMPPSIASTVAKVQVGIPIPYAGQPMRMDQDPALGNTQGRVKQLDSRFFVRVWNSLGGAISNGSTTYYPWISGGTYAAGSNVLSPANNQAYSCVVAVSGSAVDPSLNTTDWVSVPLPNYRAPVPIDYKSPLANPFALPALVTVPTDKEVPPQLVETPGTDPIVIVTGQDALPLTVLALISKVLTTD